MATCDLFFFPAQNMAIFAVLFSKKSLCSIRTGDFSCRDSAKIHHPKKKKKEKKEKTAWNQGCFFLNFVMQLKWRSSIK
jgi:hypothetical protein